MVLHQTKIFFGIRLTLEQQRFLDSTNSLLVQEIVGGGDAYLVYLCTGGDVFLGKFVRDLTSVEDLAPIEAHIASLIRKVFPNHNFGEVSIRLRVMVESDYTINQLCRTKS